jgi:hypothetical protein
MRDRATVLRVLVYAALLLPICSFASDPAQNPGVNFIVTSAPVYTPLAELRGQERFPKGAQLKLVHESKAETLAPGFAATSDANVSFDAATVLFSGKRNAGDPWQIWEMTFADRSVRKVIATSTDAERPMYLPGGRMVWAERTQHGFQLESGPDGHEINARFLNPTTGPGLLPLAYTQSSTFPADVLKDGRILFESGFPLGSGSTPELYLVYADGSGVESYRCDHGRARWGGRQLASGDVVFTHGTSLARFTSPLAHEQAIAAPAAEYAGSIAEMPSGAWLVSARAHAGESYAIKLLKLESSPKTAQRTLQAVFSLSGENLVDPVLLAPRVRPNRHPSGLHPWNYANLLALDARLSRDGVLKGSPAAVRLEMQDAAGRAVAMGTAPVEHDGSFFVKVPGDRPIRFSLLDAKGAVLRQERGWFWARGGEQRICVGCHTGPERAAENRVPGVLLRTTTPVDLTSSGQTSGAMKTVAGGR